MEVYTDASYVPNGQGNSYGGIGIYFGDDDKRNISECIVIGDINHQTMEMLAVLRALQLTIREDNIIINSDSQFVVDALTGKCDKHSPKSSKKKIPHHELMIQCRDMINKRDEYGFKTKIKHVHAHSGNKSNNAADRLAGEASHKFIVKNAN